MLHFHRHHRLARSLHEGTPPDLLSDWGAIWRALSNFGMKSSVLVQHIKGAPSWIKHIYVCINIYMFHIEEVLIQI